MAKVTNPAHSGRLRLLLHLGTKYSRNLGTTLFGESLTRSQSHTASLYAQFGCLFFTTSIIASTLRLTVPLMLDQRQMTLCLSSAFQLLGVAAGLLFLLLLRKKMMLWRLMDMLVILSQLYILRAPNEIVTTQREAASIVFGLVLIIVQHLFALFCLRLWFYRALWSVLLVLPITQLILSAQVQHHVVILQLAALFTLITTTTLSTGTLMQRMLDNMLNLNRRTNDLQSLRRAIDCSAENILFLDQDLRLHYSNKPQTSNFGELADLLSLSVNLRDVIDHASSFTIRASSQENDTNAMNTTIDVVIKNIIRIGDAERCFSFDSQTTDHRAVQIKVVCAEFAGVSGAFVIVSDISKACEVARLKEMLDNKTRMFASLTHELRTPLGASIVLLKEAMNDGRIDSSVANEHLAPALGCSKLLLSIVNDILDFSQLHFKSLRLVPQAFNLRDQCSEVTAMFHLQCEKRGIALTIDIADDVPAQLYSEPNRFSQILVNLLSNAVKFTSEGSIALKITFLPTAQQICVSVRDTGIGIKRESLVRLFEFFSKLDQESTALINPQGAGLGLAISQNLLHLLGSPKGLQVESALGAGTHFWFELPVVMQDIDHHRMDESQLQIAVPTFHTNNNREGLTTEFSSQNGIAVVDDNDFNLMAINRQLLSHGHKDVKTFSSGEKLLDALKQGAIFKLILLDSNMPSMNGMETLSKIGEMFRKRLITILPNVVICTAGFIEQEKADFLKLGAVDYLLKPISETDLRRVLNML